MGVSRTAVLIGQAYFLRLDPKLWAARQPYPPLGALYAAAAVRQAGVEVAVFDAMLARSERDWTRALEAHAPRVAVLYEDSFNYLTKMCLLRMREAAAKMIAACTARGIPVVVAGSDATDHPEIYLAAGARFVIAGEGEQTLVELVDAMLSGHPASVQAIRGVVYAGANGEVVRTPPRLPLKDLDALPRPAWDLVDVDAYRDTWHRHHGYFALSIATTRGCPYHCNWCAKPIYGQRYSVRSPYAVAEEIAWLRATLRPDHLWIVDDLFGLVPGWIARFADAVRARGVVTPFKCLLRADGVDDDVAAALARAGCRTAWIGAESGSQRILDAMEKGTRVEQVAEATGHLHRHGISVGFFLQFGYPGEDREDIAQTLAMVRHCRPDDIGVSISYPLPGTKFYERVKTQLGERRNWVDSNDLAMMYSATFAPEFYRTLHAFTHAEFRVARACDRLAGHPRGGQVSAFRDVTAGVAAALRLPVLHWRLQRQARRPLTRDPSSVAALTEKAASVAAGQE